MYFNFNRKDKCKTKAWCSQTNKKKKTILNYVFPQNSETWDPLFTWFSGKALIGRKCYTELEPPGHMGFVIVWGDTWLCLESQCDQHQNKSSSLLNTKTRWPGPTSTSARVLTGIVLFSQPQLQHFKLQGKFIYIHTLKALGDSSTCKVLLKSITINCLYKGQQRVYEQHK